MPPLNYYAKSPDPPPSPPPPLIQGAPLPQSADVQLCELCNKIYRKEHFNLHQQAYHPHPPTDNPTDNPPILQAPDTNCPLCRGSSKITHFENTRLLFFHFLKCHLPDNLHKYFNQADKVKPLILKPSLPLPEAIEKKRGRRKGKRRRDGDGGDPDTTSAPAADKQGVTCPDCGKCLTGDLRRHMARVHDKGTTSLISWKCPQDNCKVSCNSRAGLRKHLYEGHFNLWREKIQKWFGDGGNFKCGLCGWRGGDKWECLVHFILGHSNRLEEGMAGDSNLNLNLKCPLPDCGEIGGNKEGMRRHVKWIHGGKGLNNWRCPFKEECGGKVILNQEDLEEHWGRYHGSREAVLLRKQGNAIRGVKLAGKKGEGKLFENKVCLVKMGERVKLNG